MDLYSDRIMHIGHNIITPVRMLLCFLLLGFMWLGQISCRHKEQVVDSAAEVMIDSLIPEYSHSFRVDYYKDYKVVKVYKEASAKPIATYVLCKKEVKLPGSSKVPQG
jgi:hypothetical protein